MCLFYSLDSRIFIRSVCRGLYTVTYSLLNYEEIWTPN